MKTLELSPKKVEIFGENSISIAAIFEYLQLPNHPFHEQAKEKASSFIEAQQNEQRKRDHESMQRNMENMTQSEWSRIVD